MCKHEICANSEKTSNEISDIVKRMGKAECEARECINDLQLKMGFSDTLEYDGETVTKEKLSVWYSTLEEMDKFCYYV